MKIALVHRYYPQFGGITTVVSYLKKGLEKRNKVEVITQQKCKEKNVRVLSQGKRGFYFKLFKYLKSEKFDIIHTHSVPICFFSPFLKTKIVLTIHGYESIFEKMPLLKNLYIRFISLTKILGYHFADSLISVSSLITEDVVRKYKINEKKISVINNVVDLDLFKQKQIKNKGKSKEIRIFSYGTGIRKGFPVILKIAENLSVKHKNIKFIIVGGKPEIPKHLERYFEFYKFVPFKDMPKIYNSVDIVLLASLYDPFGITPVEGMACGKPVIVSKNSGVKDVIESGITGIVCDLRDFEKNIDYLIENKQIRLKMGKLAKRTIGKKVSFSAFIKKHEEIYNALTKKI